MEYLIYRKNTHGFLAGYDGDGNPLWTPVGEIGELAEFPSLDKANSECDSLLMRGFFVDIVTARDESIKDEW